MGTSSGEPKTSMSFTPIVIRNLLQCCDHSSSQGLSDVLKGQRIDLSLEEFVRIGSAVLKDIQSSSITGTSEASLLACLPSLKPTIQECFSFAISRLLSEAMKKQSMKSQHFMHSQVPAASHEMDHIPQSCSTEFDCYGSDGETRADETFPEKTEPIIMMVKCEQRDDSDLDPAVEIDCESDSGPSFIKLPPGESLSSHADRNITKNVPPHILYNLRGVRCRLCWKVFRRTDAVDALVRHTEEVHPEKATASFLRVLRRANAFDKIIGKGIPYCTCEYCKEFGLA